jgi:hypothetical protein
VKYTRPEYKLNVIETNDVITASSDYKTNNCTVNENVQSAFGGYEATNITGNINSLFRK